MSGRPKRYRRGMEGGHSTAAGMRHFDRSPQYLLRTPGRVWSLTHGRVYMGHPNNARSYMLVFGCEPANSK